MQREKSKNWPRLTDYATFVMSQNERGQTGYSPADIFCRMTTSRMEIPHAHAGNPDVESWINVQKVNGQDQAETAAKETKHKAQVP